MIIKPSNRISDVKTYYFATKLAEIARMNETGEAVLNLGIGSPDLLPPKEVIETLKSASEGSTANKYQPYKGTKLLREAFSNHYEKMLRVAVNPETEILPLIGSKEGIMHIAMSFLNEGDEVLVPNPGYPSYSATAALAGATPIYYNLNAKNNWLPNLDELRKKNLTKVKIMWINYPNMPTGANMDISTLKELVGFTKEHNILLCHDNPYNFILNDSPRSIFTIPEARENCLELYSLSKCFNMSGWRVGALVGKKEYVDTVLRFKSNMDSGMYLPIQHAAAKALSLDNKWFDELNQHYAKRRKIVYEIFDLLNCEYDISGSGMFVWAKAPSYITDVKEWMDELLQQARVFLTPGFIFGSNGSDYVRISLCADEEKLKQAKGRIERRFIKAIA